MSVNIYMMLLLFVKRGKKYPQETQAITCLILLTFTLIEFSINKFFMKRKCIIEETASTQFDKSRYIQNQYHTDERDWSGLFF